MRLTAIRLRDGGNPVAVADGPVLACRFALAFVDWAAGITAPILGASRGARLTAIRTGPGFQCRARNRQSGEKPSAHGSGLAVDIAAFEFAAGPPLRVGADGQTQADGQALAAIRRAACGWFTTILGPGTDPFHADHLHLDLQLHGSSDRYRICQ